MERQFTATAYIIDNKKTLLVYHAKLAKWLPPGGHIEKDETPQEAALREAIEETGMTLSLYSQENILIDAWNAKSLGRPYLCLLENIPAHKTVPAHQHIDFIYIAKPAEQLQPLPSNCRWFAWDDLLELKPNIEIFQETLDVIKHLFENVKI